MQVHLPGVFATARREPPAHGAFASDGDVFEQPPQLTGQIGRDHVEHSARRSPRGIAHERRSGAVESDDLKPRVDGDARGKEVVEEDTLRRPLKIAGCLHPPGQARHRVIGCGLRPYPRGARGDCKGVPREDSALLVHRLEELAETAERLRVPQHETASRQERIVELRHHPALERRTQVDEDVAAAHQVDMRQGRVPREVMPCEDAVLAHGLVDPVAAITGHEETLQQFWAHGSHTALRVDSLACGFQVAIADVGGEDLQWATDA